MGQIKQLVHGLHFSFDAPVSLTKSDRCKIASFIASLAATKAHIREEKIIGWSSDGSNVFHLKVVVKKK